MTHRKTRVSRLLMTFVLAASSHLAQAMTVTIDFDGFSAGDGLAIVNATTTPLGVTFDAALFGGAAIIDQGGGDFALRAERLPFNTTVVANFAVPANAVSVDFERQSGPTDESSSMTFYNQPQSAAAVNAGQIEYGVSGFTVPGTLASSWIPDSGQGPPSRIRSAWFNQSWGSGNPDTYWVIDNLVVELVPIPPALGLFVSALAGLALVGVARNPQPIRHTAVPGPY